MMDVQLCCLQGISVDTYKEHGGDENFVIGKNKNVCVVLVCE